MGDILKLVANTEAPTPDLMSVAACLRNLAANIEDGRYGEAVRGAVVIRSADLPPLVFGQGPTSISQTYMDLAARMAELMSMNSPVREP